MEYDQIQSGEYQETGKKSLRWVFRLFGTFIFTFLVFGAGFYFSIILLGSKEHDITDDQVFTEVSSDDSSPQPSRPEPSLLLDEKFLEMTRRGNLLEERLASIEQLIASLSKDVEESDLIRVEIESLRGSLDMRFVELERQFVNANTSELNVLDRIEARVLKADEYLVKKENPLIAITILKDLSFYTDQLNPDTQSEINTLISEEIAKLEELLKLPVYRLPNKLEDLSRLISQLEVQKNEKQNVEVMERSIEKPKLEFGSVTNAAWEELKALVSVSNIDYGLIDQIAADNFHLIKLQLQLEVVVARGCLNVSNFRGLRVSLENLERLRQVYLAESKPIEKLLIEINQISLLSSDVKPPDLSESLRRINELRILQGL